ncbi:iron-containing alcohol dehydrogenase [Anaerotruncus colihominis]|uniref:iron-containing alcohol dehydrogenase n=1 Tax=Anaerotruncus colihominis TaxID=169435 RepID=UPI001899EBC9|nr:iron-containing alcohol dehydrogenase [Anaerotruncus colihominis]
MSYQMFLPTKVLFGPGRLNELQGQPMPGKKALLVISDGKSVRENGALARTQEQLRLAGADYVLFDRVQANPLRSTVMEGACAAKEHSCDFVVALGGGSVMDASKAIAAMAANSGDLWDYMGGGTGKAKTLENQPLPLIAITTTAGTGSEVDRWGVVTNEETNEKMGFGGYDSLFPVLSVVDPELMMTVPPRFTAYQGFDALFHSTECYISKAHNLMSDMITLTAIENIATYLPRAVQDGADIEARERVAFANTLSGHAMELSSCTSEHSMEHAMSAYHQSLPHGAGLIMISRAYYEYFVERRACDDRFIRMARAMGISAAGKPEDFITALVKLQEDCGVADLKMSSYGILQDELDGLAENARKTMSGLFEADPCPVSHEDCVSIFRKAYR